MPTGKDSRSIFRSRTSRIQSKKPEHSSCTVPLKTLPAENKASLLPPTCQLVTIIYIRKVASNVWYTVNSNEERTHYLWSEQDSSTKRNLILCSHKPRDEPEYEPWRSVLWGVELTFKYWAFSFLLTALHSNTCISLTTTSNLLYLAFHLLISEYTESKLLHSSQFSISKGN